MRLLIVTVLLVGCHNNGGNGLFGQTDARTHLIDGATTHDAAADAHNGPHLFDANLHDAFLSPQACSVLAQSGCNLGQKCSWFHDATTPFPLGHIGCAPTGSVIAGSACTFGPDGANGYDNCTAGNVCLSGVCKPICDVSGGLPSCGVSASCGTYSDLFDEGGQTIAGVCAASCDPLADNDFLANGTQTGHTCAAGQGCYGFPGDSQPTTFTCNANFNTTLVHRSACTVANNCQPSTSNVYLNGCAAGYLPLLTDSTGSAQVDCIAMCKPSDCYLGNCTGTALRGAAPHDCSSTSARGTFNLSVVGGNNGDQCFYSWGFEYDSMGNHIPSATSDTVGYCIDHSKYDYDSNNDGMVGPGDATWPRCDTLGIGSAVNNGYDAAFFGCVSTTTATANGHTPARRATRLVDLPHPPFAAAARTRP